ncbi:tRNA (adenosine(37)-N6)-threonylcarbamoyltransferase complex ATPase subunit type 1 TsaE [Pseudoruegeria sp. SHC-113]|uniref:tRNA (adenosine(37)-N6)-threonylcarbamoyltransferase complex ATPase subunit type 1 TsaE n=1 Tax=Pseudoruegeria sp. SHC-113 TaxID=2855439 RepID=UPI0021BA653B|nr:tRNA (adenosine(37)-N6)-threonylcarbamoyltransferase complex ATPase subunit type 1 TsaE [Pseudoruegeria sp. SHC-113]MCT8158600.1 tRNA (adenosine(37)-N6)-threonylcarbamoyltransferase complex ATPase subunit type 1 TsaE [Pseudoruegeria sp. SHC-113]
MSDARLSLTLADETASTELAQQLAPLLEAGDCLLLSGPVGAGKSHFARSLILALLPEPEDVPSPTFTLVQTYDAPAFEIWHCDLYRLSGPEDAFELGLDEAFDTALCLVEWPDRLGAYTPRNALELSFAHQPDGTGRSLALCGPRKRWAGVLDGLHA